MDTEVKKITVKKKIKEGFMIKKGHIRHNWKPRWFILYENGLNYYKSNRHSEPLNEINLRGCSVVSPCPEYTKKEHVFRLIEHSGREYLLQCNDEEERKDWTADISEVIRSLEAIEEVDMPKEEDEVTPENLESQLSAKRTSLREKQVHSILGSKVSFEEMLEAMQDSDAGVPYSSHVINQTAYKLCFTGMQLIDWLISWNFASSREDGYLIAGELLEKAHLHPVGPLSNSSLKRKESRRAFCDVPDALYRFSSLKFDGGLDVEFGFSDSSSDSGEDKDDNVALMSADTTFGQLIKQGFLVKQGHIRHNWKVRKFVLRDCPASLSYHIPSRTSRSLKGTIRLQDCEVRPLNKEESEKQLSLAKGSKKFINEHCFLIKLKNGTSYLLQAQSASDREDWVQALNSVIKGES